MGEVWPSAVLEAWGWGVGGIMGHPCNPSYSRGGAEDLLEDSLAKSGRRCYFKKQTSWA
jgi:hypothetical protein